MKVIEQADATAPLAQYVADIQSGPVVVTRHGEPVAALVPIKNADLETVALSNNPEFLDLVERSRARARGEGGISRDEMLKRLSGGRSMEQDLQHLRLLSIFHYIVGGLMALFACFPVIHLVIGILIINGSLNEPAHRTPPEVGWFFIAIAAPMILIGWMLAVAIVVAGGFLARHVHPMYCLIVAGIESCFLPFGTALGVLTIIVLERPSVKALFAASSPSNPPGGSNRPGFGLD